MADDERNLAKRPKPATGSVEDYQPETEDAEGPSEEDLARFSDVTVTCKGCGTELLDDVSECWKCGRPVAAAGTHETGLPTWVVLTAAVSIAIAVGWLFFR